MSTTGAQLARSVVTAAEDPWLDNDWVNPANIYGAGEAEVSAATYDAGDQTYVLKAYNFDFSAIPAGAAIDGVIVVINARYATALVSIDLVQLLDVSRGKVGTNKAATPQALTTSAANYTFGTNSDKWGNALDAAWVKDADFGVAIGCLAGSTGNSNNDVFIDSVTMEVYYTAGTTINAAAGAVTIAGQAITVTPGAVSVSENAAALTLAGQALTVTPGAVSVAESEATMSLAGQPITVDAPVGGIVVNLQPG